MKKVVFSHSLFFIFAYILFISFLYKIYIFCPPKAVPHCPPKADGRMYTHNTKKVDKLSFVFCMFALFQRMSLVVWCHRYKVKDIR
jgi:hypothetical protein